MPLHASSSALGGVNQRKRRGLANLAGTFENASFRGWSCFRERLRESVGQVNGDFVAHALREDLPERRSQGHHVCAAAYGQQGGFVRVAVDGGTNLDCFAGAEEFGRVGHLDAGPAAVGVGNDRGREDGVEFLAGSVGCGRHDSSLGVVAKLWAPGPVSSSASTGLPDTASKRAIAGPRTSGPSPCSKDVSVAIKRSP